MKRSDKTYNTGDKVTRTTATVLMWLLPLLLVVPNIALDITEISYSALDRAVNFLLPVGVWLLLCSLWKRPGRTALFLIPIMVLCAFQIVLLFLYGESIIAIDMFLNVATTNPSEAGELLGCLSTAIITVLALYLPPIGVAIWLTVAKTDLCRARRRPAIVAGGVLAAAGLVCLLTDVAVSDYRPDRKLFPVNVVSNMFCAAGRTERTETYYANSRNFSFDATDTRDTAQPEIYVLIVGETSRAGNWQLFGYDRPTNPRLSRREGLVCCPKALSESNTTHKSVPLMLSHLSAVEFGDSIYRSKGIIDVFKDAGYSTAWLSNQKRNHSLIDFFGSEADETRFITDDGAAHYDDELCGLLDDFLERNKARKCFVVLHTYGSHFCYNERYPERFSRFTPDSPCDASADNRERLINAYDNSIRYIDTVLDSIIGIVQRRNVPASVVYAADHGEDIYDDDRGRFLHASPTPTYRQLHVPMFVWMSDSYRKTYPEKSECVRTNSGKDISTSRSVFHTLLSLAGADTRFLDTRAALCETVYTPSERVYLNDYDEAVPLRESGLRDEDFRQLHAAGISYGSLSEHGESLADGGFHLDGGVGVEYRRHGLF